MEEVRDWTTRHTKTWKRWLAEFAGRPRVAMLEIGCFAGRSTEWFCDTILTGAGSHLDAVDLWEGKAAEVEPLFDAVAASRPVTKHKARSTVVLPRLMNSGARFNIVYVDGGHYAETVLFDMVVGWSMLRRGGVMIMDDYGWTHRQCPIPPRVAIDAWLSVHVRGLAGYETSNTSQVAAWKQ